MGFLGCWHGGAAIYGYVIECSANSYKNVYLHPAQVIGHWYPFGLVVVLINVVFIFCHPHIPESPRWLISKKRFVEAAELINDIR